MSVSTKSELDRTISGQVEDKLHPNTIEIEKIIYAIGTNQLLVR